MFPSCCCATAAAAAAADTAAASLAAFALLFIVWISFRLFSLTSSAIPDDISFVVAGTGMANTPLMRQLESNPDFTVAQFAQAIGAVYYANS